MFHGSTSKNWFNFILVKDSLEIPMRSSFLCLIYFGALALSPLMSKGSSRTLPVVGNGQGLAPQQTSVGGAVVRPYQNDFLIVNLDFASIRREKERVLAFVSLVFENKSSREEFLSYADERYLGLMDSNGHQWRCVGLNGLQKTYSGNNSPAFKTGKARFSRLAPGSRQIVLVKFELMDRLEGPLGPTTASIALDLFRFQDSDQEDKYQSFSVGLMGIPLGK
jgi:hypothetical protein